MKILLTGATGYIAQRLLPVLLDNGYEVVCLVRDVNRFDSKKYKPGKLAVIEADLLNHESLNIIPGDIDAAYYLVHSMSGTQKDFNALEKKSAAPATTASAPCILKKAIRNGDLRQFYLMSTRGCYTYLVIENS